MIVLVLLVYIGRLFYKTAELYGKNKIAYTILGVATYYVGSFLFGLLIGIYLLFTDSDMLKVFDSPEIGFSELPIGIISCVILYHSLKYFWAKEKDKKQVLDTLDDGIL